MKISIITVVFNGANTIRHCIESVLSQDYPSIEYIIIDGNSTDETQAIVRSFGNRIQNFVSEPDSGIYDAMNKGIAKATGDVIGILNADDFYAYNSVLADVAKAMSTHGAQACYGDLQYVDSMNASLVKRSWVSGEYKSGAFLNGWMPPHPTFFVRKEVYAKYGKFSLNLGSAADYELMLRLVHKARIRVTYVPKVLVKMRIGGVSNATLKNRLAANRNDLKAWEVNNLNPRFYTLWLKPLRKIIQFI